MKKTLLMAGALLALTAGIASAQGGINLGWGDCGGGPATLSKTFACTSNTLTGAIIVASAVAGTDMANLDGEESEIILQTNQPALSNFWQMQAGGCRQNQISASFDFTGGPFTCIDAWSGGASGGMNYTPAFGGPNRAQIRTIAAIPGDEAITGTDEYYFYKITLLGTKITGNGSCAGCTDGACFVFTSLKLTQTPGTGADVILTTPAVRQFVTWQAGGAGVTGGCPAATPTQNRTWGSVKSLYR